MFLAGAGEEAFPAKVDARGIFVCAGDVVGSLEFWVRATREDTSDLDIWEGNEVCFVVASQVQRCVADLSDIYTAAECYLLTGVSFRLTEVSLDDMEGVGIVRWLTETP